MKESEVVRHLKLVSGEEILCTMNTSDNILYISKKPVYVDLENNSYVMSDMLPLSDYKECSILGTNIAFMATAADKVAIEYNAMVSKLSDESAPNTPIGNNTSYH